MLIFQGFASSRIVREFPPFSFKVRIATLTRNQLTGQTVRGFESLHLRHMNTTRVSNFFIGTRVVSYSESLALQGFPLFINNPDAS